MSERAVTSPLENRHARIYSQSAWDYDALIAAEDCDHNLRNALTELVGQSDCGTLVDVGTGTGRIVRWLAPHMERVVGLDRSPEMLRVAARTSGAAVSPAVSLVVSDALTLPVASGVATMAVAAWVFGHFCEWWAGDWVWRVERAIGEMRRTTKPGGKMLIIESLGTCVDRPDPPTPSLRQYHSLLTERYGFERRVVSTDYRFPDVTAASRMLGFFFGDAIADEIRRRGSGRVPEWTGLWVATVS